MPGSALACLGNIFVDPRKALSDIRGHTAWLWYPLLVSVLVSGGFLAWYYLTVDFGWLVDQLLSARATSMSAEQMDTARRSMTRGSFLLFGVGGSALGLLILYGLQALYYLLVSKLAGYPVSSYGEWFSFTAWTALPNVLSTVVAAAAYLFAPSRQVDPFTLDLTSLNTLVFHLPLGSRWSGIASSVHLTNFWVLGLMIFGFAQWTRRPLGRSAAVVLAPYALIYGLWILIKLI